jgi:squalene synthase HpnC
MRAVSIGHYENFPVASLLCPPLLRGPIVAIYRFARTADDIADEGSAAAAERLAALRDYAAALEDAAAGRRAGRWPEVFDPLRTAIAEHALPVSPLHDLLEAFSQDCGNPRYADHAELLDYCRRSANPIGRLLLHLYGVRDVTALARADAICTALQLINFWQDPSVDLPRGRSYFPREDLERHGIGEAELRAGVDTPATQALIAALCGRARELMREGSPLATALPGRIGWELRLVVQGGLRILDKIERGGHRTLSARPTLAGADLPAMLWRAARMRAAPARPLERAA